MTFEKFRQKIAVLETLNKKRDLDQLEKITYKKTLKQIKTFRAMLF
jgi:hypothetical protein